VSVTGREREIVSALAAKIRMLSFDQIRREWWPESASSERNARRRLSELVEAGLLVRQRVAARPLLPLDAPAFRWKPGADAPEYSSLSWRLQKRWVEPEREVTAYLATRRAAAIFGGRSDGRMKNAAQATHDLHVGGLYLKLRKSSPKLAAGWIGEDVLAPTRADQKLPDAVLHDGEGKPRLVMEFGGAYPPERVEAFHEDCAVRGLPYELW
jgi:hypothetical protein